MLPYNITYASIYKNAQVCIYMYNTLTRLCGNICFVHVLCLAIAYTEITGTVSVIIVKKCSSYREYMFCTRVVVAIAYTEISCTVSVCLFNCLSPCRMYHSAG